LQNKLKNSKIEAKILTGEIEMEARDKMIDEFRKLNFTTLISTNVLARGIDVPEVDIVVNFDVPIMMNEGKKDPDYANFMHRVGRTGRFGTDGVAVTLMADETDEEMMRLIAKHYDIEIIELKSFDQLFQAFGEMRGKPM
jgi:ATP-dependent RNA helicase DDX19/DBP5